MHSAGFADSLSDVPVCLIEVGALIVDETISLQASMLMTLTHMQLRVARKVLLIRLDSRPVGRSVRSRDHRCANDGQEERDAEELHLGTRRNRPEF